MSKKQTVFQALDKAINGNWGRQDAAITPHVNSYDMSSHGKDIIYRTTNKDDYEQKKLELQQDKYLKDRWVKANVNLSVTAFAGLNNIKLMYRDADLMDAFPEIGAALDIVSEEASITNGGDGMVVHVSSKSERVKGILEDLFVNRLNLQLTAQMIIRAMAKYGNQFMLLNIDRKNGVMGWKQLPVFNVERIENGIQNPYGAGASIAVNGVNSIDPSDLSTQFVWLDDNNSQVPFREWQVAHFRLLSNSLYLPYGCSYLNAARRHWRMLSLMEDLMLIYRLERSIERRVYKIYVGAIDDADIPAYIEQVANEFKRTPIIDPMTGQVDLRKNILPVHKDTPIPLLDGRTITIEQLAKEYEEGKENYVYSVQDKTLQIVPGKVVWCGKNYTAEKLVKITLDDETYTIMAPEHEIIMRDGSKKRADEVREGESVMPLYRKDKKMSPSTNLEYEQVYNPNNGKYEFTHRLVGKEISKTQEQTVIHHKDFNRHNNSPLNLQWMGWKEHRDYHLSLNTCERIRQIRREGGQKRWMDAEFRNRAQRNMTIQFDQYVWDEIEKAVVRGEVYSQNTMIRYINDNLIDYLKTINNCHKLIRYGKVTKPLVKARLKDRGYVTSEEYLSYLDDKYHLESHNKRLQEQRRQTAIKYHVIANFKEPWYLNAKRSQCVRHKISESNRKRAALGAYQKVADSNRIKFDDYVWSQIRQGILSHMITCATELYDYVNTELIGHLLDINGSKRLHECRCVNKKAILKRIKEKYGFATTNEYIEAIRKNHKILKVEWVGGDDVYCMTVQGLKGEEDRHNFALCSINADGSWNRNGIFVSNCVDQDLFIPVRDPAAPTPIDTLAPAQNLTAMDDIKFVQNKVLTALRIPKTFLNFEENAGDGKNLALMDIRFTRTINRIQQAFLMELTRVASIHLFLLGFDDELTNFTLSMNNPSTQAEQLEIENMQKKIDAVRDAVSDPGNGLPVMSLMRALREIMKWSDKQIKENFEEIRLEKGIAAELEKTPQIIQRTGVFDKVDRIYGEPGAEYIQDQQGQGGMGDAMSGSGGMGGGPAPSMDSGSDLDGLGAPGADDTGDITGQEGSMPTGEMPIGDEENQQQQPMESKSKKKPLINESKVLDELFDRYLKQLDEAKDDKDNAKTIRADIYDKKSLLLSEEFDKMIGELSKYVDEE